MHVMLAYTVTKLTIFHVRRLLVILVISRFGFEGGISVMIASVPGHCLIVTSMCVLWSLFLSYVSVTLYCEEIVPIIILLAACVNLVQVRLKF